MSFNIHLLHAAKTIASLFQVQEFNLYGHINFGEDWISGIGVGAGEQGAGGSCPSTLFKDVGF